MAGKRPPARKPAPRKSPTTTQARLPRRKPAKDELCPVAATEVAILRVLADPKMLRKTASEKAAAAGISRSCWFERLADPLFRARARATVRDTFQEHLGPVLDALTHMAMELDPKCH